MNTILTIINDGDKLFDETFDNVNTTIVKITSELGFVEQKSCVDDIKAFTHSRELALVEGLKARYEGMKVLDTADTIYKKIIGGDNIEGQVDGYNKALSLAIAELDEAIIHLKEKK